MIFRLLILGLTLLAMAEPAIAGPPLITDDPGVPPQGTWEINIALTADSTRRVTTWNTPQFDINYSLTDTFQLTYNLPILVEDRQDHGPVAGLASSAISFKWQLLTEEKCGFDLAITPALFVGYPARWMRHDLVEPGTSVFLPLEIGRSFDKFDVFAEAGYLTRQHGGDEWSYGIAGVYRVNDKLNLMAELHAFSDSSFRNNDVLVNVGCFYSVSKDFNLMLSVGRSLRDTDENTQLYIYAGVQLLR